MKANGEMRRESHLLPLYLLFGDEFLVKEELAKIVSGVLDKDLRQTNLIVLSGAELAEGYLFSLINTPSLFGDPRVILVEDTTLFSGNKDTSKLVDRVIEAVRSNDSKTVLRYVGQLFRIRGVSSTDIVSGDEWLDGISKERLSSDARDFLQKAARQWLESGKALDANHGEGIIEDLVQCSFPEGTVLIFTALIVDKKKRSFKLMQEYGHVTECIAVREKFGARLDRSFFDNRVRSMVADLGKKISREAVGKMYERAGTDLRRLQGEVDKLVNYLGNRDTIEAADVENVFDDFHGTEFFELSGAIKTGDINKCIPALHEHLRIVAHPLQTLAAITSEIRRLLVAKELRHKVFGDTWRPGMSWSGFRDLFAYAARKETSPESARKIARAGMKPYSLYLSIEASDRFSEDKLIGVMEDLLEADIMFKSSRLGRYGAQAILENIIFRLCRRP